jgi:hypothetical protein
LIYKVKQYVDSYAQENESIPSRASYQTQQIYITTLPLITLQNKQNICLEVYCGID